ncbi:MAG: hypothetical protein V4596_11425 [Bdellovibrionota bacterium]
MDKLKEIFDQLKDPVLARWDQFQESDTYISLREKYDNLPVRGQKLVVFLAFFMAFLVVFSIPYVWHSSSQDSVAEFEDTKFTIAELLEVSQEIKNIPPQSLGLTSADLKMRVDRVLTEKGLTKEQITSLSETQFTNPQGSTLIPPQINATGIETHLKQLTLKQIVDIGYELDRISPLVKVLNLEMKATEADVHFYDVQFRVSSFNVKEAAPAAAAPKNQRNKRE